jgi:hypothetical protein
MFAAFAALALLAAQAQANLLDDPGFEAATGGTQTSNSAWTLTANFPDPVDPPVETEGSAQFQFANWSSYPPGAPPGMGVWFKSFKGDDPAVGPAALAHADLSQSAVAADAGNYVLSYWAKRETNFLAGNADPTWLTQLSSSGGGSSTVDMLAAVPNDGQWHQLQLILAGVNSGDTLTVRTVMANGHDAGANPQSGFVDEYELRLVPEPTALVLACFGVLGLRRRR